MQQGMDILFAMLIERSPLENTFYPSRSGQPWEALVKGYDAITKAETLARDKALNSAKVQDMINEWDEKEDKEETYDGPDEVHDV